MSQNNPIQERIEQLLIKWTKAIAVPKAKIVRILGETDEQDMLDAFFEYMLAVDTEQEDFVIVLDTPLIKIENFSELLLNEVLAEITQWNTAKISAGIPFEKITWTPNYDYKTTDNLAQLFLKNMIELSKYLIPDQDIKFSIVLRMYRASKKDATKWLEDALKVDGFSSSNVIIGLQDKKTAPLFSSIADTNFKEVITIYPNFNMDKALEQLAGLGDPAAAETPYRVHLVKLMNAVEKREKEKVSAESKSCINIIVNQLKKDPNWLIQLVAIYTILYSDQVGYKKYNKAIYFADKAVETALQASILINPDMAYRLVGQTHLGRGSLYAVKKNWDKALEDYLLAAKGYNTCADALMECESLRLSGWVYEKLMNSKEAIKCYIKGYRLIHKITPETIRGSTFPLIVQKLLYDKQRQKEISDAEMNKDLTQIFGDDWEIIIDKYGKAPIKQSLTEA